MLVCLEWHVNHVTRYRITNETAHIRSLDQSTTHKMVPYKMITTHHDMQTSITLVDKT